MRQEIETIGTPLHSGLRPGASFEYTSGCPLTTPSGLMQGAYQFEDEDGGFFEAKIPLFALDSPYDERRPN